MTTGCMWLTHRNAMKATMTGVAHSDNGHMMIGVAVRKIMRKREVCLEGAWKVHGRWMTEGW